MWLWADWPAPPGVRAGVSTRLGGVSRGAFATLNLATHVDDAPTAVAENRRRLAAHLCLPAAPVWLEQVHGTRVIDLSSAAGDRTVPADSAVTDRPGTICAVLTADCLSVVFTDASGSRVGVAHAGWRGLVGGVLEATMAALGVAPRQLLAWLGPAISQAHFEIGDDVRQAFLQQDPGCAGAFVANDGGRWQADLFALARRQLRRAGVVSMHGGGMCTYADERRFFSHRRDGRCGRMVTLAWLTGD